MMVHRSTGESPISKLDAGVNADELHYSGTASDLTCSSDYKYHDVSDTNRKTSFWCGSATWKGSTIYETIPTARKQCSVPSQC